MNRLKLAFRITNGLLLALMAFASIPDLLQVKQAVEVFDRLGYPTYLLPFIGVAKLLGIAALVARVPSRLKEWAYMGFVMDCVGAVYSHLMVGDSLVLWWGALLGLVLSVSSYALFLMNKKGMD